MVTADILAEGAVWSAPVCASVPTPPKPVAFEKQACKDCCAWLCQTRACSASLSALDSLCGAATFLAALLSLVVCGLVAPKPPLTHLLAFVGFAMFVALYTFIGVLCSRRRKCSCRGRSCSTPRRSERVVLPMVGVGTGGAHGGGAVFKTVSDRPPHAPPPSTHTLTHTRTIHTVPSRMVHSFAACRSCCSHHLVPLEG